MHDVMHSLFEYHIEYSTQKIEPWHLLICLPCDCLPFLGCYCHGLNVCVPQIACAGMLTLKDDSNRSWGLWEMIKSWRWSLHGGINAFVRRDTRAYLLSTLSTWGHSEKMSISIPGSEFSLDTRSASTFILAFIVSRTRGNKYILLKASVL